MDKIDNLQISAFFKIPKGKIEEFKRRVAEIMNNIREKGTKAMKYDVFISIDQNRCEVREEYKNSEDLIEHMVKFRETIQIKFFTDFPLEYMVLYGDPSPQLLEMTKGIDIKVYSFFQGLEEMIEA
jgi:L-rhamnose mutarotase